MTNTTQVSEEAPENCIIIIWGDADGNETFEKGIEEDTDRLTTLFDKEGVAQAIRMEAKGFSKEQLDEFCHTACDLYNRLIIYYTGHGSAGETAFPQFYVSENIPVCLFTDLYKKYSTRCKLVVGADACNVSIFSIFGAAYN